MAGRGWPSAWCVLMVAGVLACAGSDGGPDQPGGRYDPADGGWEGAGSPVPSPVGVPVAPPVSAVIGPEGGELSTDDLRFELVVPAGALSEEIEFRITPISNTAPGGKGVAYRVEPEGVRFAQPVRVRFTLDEDELEGLDAEGVRIASRGADGYWRFGTSPEVTGLGATFSASTPHLSDWTLVSLGLTLVPGSATVEVGGSVAFAVQFCRASVIESTGPGSDDLVGLVVQCSDQAPQVDGMRASWAATAGSISGNGVFTAPPEVPSPNPVTVTLRAERGGEVMLVLAPVTIEGPPDYLLLLEHTSERPDQTFSARIEGGLVLESADQARFYAFRGSVTILTEVGTTTHVCTLRSPTAQFNTGRTAVLRMGPGMSYGLSYVLPVTSFATCRPRDPDDEPIEVPQFVVGVNFVLNCDPASRLPRSATPWIEGSGTDRCALSSASWRIVGR